MNMPTEPAPPLEPVEFSEAVARAFSEAAAAHGTVERCYALGGSTICLRFAGPALLPRLTPALEHRRVPAAEAELTLHLWDGASTGIGLPPPPVRLGEQLPRGEVRGLENERLQLAVGLDAASVSLLDAGTNHGYYWIRAAEAVSVHERGAPLRSLLHWWMRPRGRHMVHAAAVGTAKGGVLLAGRGGSGKSTTALACLSAGLDYAGDDYCLLSTAEAPHISSVYSSAKVAAAQLRHFPHLETLVANEDELGQEKALAFLHPTRASQLVAGFPLRALLLPRITGQPETRLTRASAFEALRALAPSSIMQLPGAGAAEFQSLSQLVQRVPCYWLELGTAVAEVPAVIQTLLTAT